MIELDKKSLKFFNKKSIFVTGGTGSLGKELISILLQKTNPKKIVIYSRDELKQSQMIKDFSKLKHKDILRFFIGDVRDLERLKTAMNEIDLVVHAAALKHVDIAEYNPMEYVKTNVDGAKNVVEASLYNNVKKIIALSTDKATNPINLYGATKLVSDKIFVAANNIVGEKDTRFVVVRYGNVVNSRGSVIPFFKEINRLNKEFFPVTDKEMTRFWITLNQSANLILNSFINSQGGEIIIPKIPSIKILDITHSINKKKKIKIIGLRPGEKLHEVLCSQDESTSIIEFKKYFIIKPKIKYIDRNINYKKNKYNEIGRYVKKEFDYNSLTNPEYIDSKTLKKIIYHAD